MLLSNLTKLQKKISASGIVVYSQNAVKPSNNTSVPVKSDFCNHFLLILHFHLIFLKVHGIHHGIMSKSQGNFKIIQGQMSTCAVVNVCNIIQ